MFLRENRHRRASGETVVYLQLVESVWNPERRRPESRLVYNFGRADDDEVRRKLAELARGILRRVSPQELTGGRDGWKLLEAWPYGDVYVLEQMWARLGLPKLLSKLAYEAAKKTLPVERACFAMVANRALAPSSKLYCYEQWLREDVVFDGGRELELHHLYRAMDFVEKHKEEIEKEIFFGTCDLLAHDVELVFYDTTTVHFEIDAEDEGGQEDATVQGSALAGGKTYEALRQRGASKNKRTDVPQIVVGLAMTRDGLPVRSWIFRGDTVDVETVARVKEDLRGWKLGRVVFVGDAGMVSKENLETLAKGGGRYLVCMPVRPRSEVAAVVAEAGEPDLPNDVAQAPGRYQKVQENLWVKEVVVGDGERRRRYAVCFNFEEAQRQRAHREQVLTELRAELDSLRRAEDGEHKKRECILRASERYGRYLRVGRGGRLEIDPQRVKQYETLDGKFVVHTNDDTLTAADMALGYKQLQVAERAFRLVKNGLRLRPIFHWAPHRISAHVSLTMLALLLVRMIENACGDTWRHVRDDLRRIQLARVSTPHGELWQVTEGTDEARHRLKQLGIPPPSPVVGFRKDPPAT